MTQHDEEQPTLTEAELAAADLMQPSRGDQSGGDARLRRLRELDAMTRQRETEAATLTAMLRELDGSSEGQAAIADRQRRLDHAEAQRQHALDVLAGERRAAELAYAEGVQALKEIGEPNPSKAFMSSPQGRALADRNSVVMRALEAAGQPGREPPEPVEKILKARTWTRSEAHRALISKAAEIQRVLGGSDASAMQRARETLPDVTAKALAEPLAEPMATAEIRKALGGGPAHQPGSFAAQAHEVQAKLDHVSKTFEDQMTLIGIAKALAAHPAGIPAELRKSLGTAPTFAEILEALKALTPEQAAQVRAALAPPHEDPKPEVSKRVEISKRSEAVLWHRPS